MLLRFVHLSALTVLARPVGTKDTEVSGWPAPATHSAVSSRSPVHSPSIFGVASTSITSSCGSQVPFAESQGTPGGKLPSP